MLSKGKTFGLVFLPAALALMCGLALIQQKNKELSAAQFENQLKNQWLLVSVARRGGLTMDGFGEIGRLTGLRVTVVRRDGTVVYDSEVGGAEAMENHAEREEIRNALLGWPSMSRRRSASTGLWTIYYAEKIDDDQVLRVAYPAGYYLDMERALMTQAFSGLAALVVAVTFFALLVSRSTSRTLGELGRAVSAARQGSEDFPAFNSEPLDAALYSLSAVTRESRARNAEVSSLNARLEYILNNIQEGVLLFEENEVLYRNERSAAILGDEIPANLTLVDKVELLTVLETLTGDKPVNELFLGDKIISVSRAVSGRTKLAVLHDVTDREKYAGWKSELIGNVSHELKTPLALIMSASEVMLKDPEMPRAYLDKFLQAIFRNSRRVNELVDDLVSLHRLEALGVDEPSESDLDEVVREAVELTATDGKKIICRCDGGAVRIHATHLLSAATNLLSNAVKYSSGSEVDIVVVRRGSAVEMSVSDQGPVIPSGERERIFERFYSLSKSRSRGDSGTGLGLSIVKHIAKLYHGQVTVTENDIGGNTFTVKLIER